MILCSSKPLLFQFLFIQAGRSPAPLGTPGGRRGGTVGLSNRVFGTAGQFGTVSSTAGQAGHRRNVGRGTRRSGRIGNGRSSRIRYRRRRHFDGRLGRLDGRLGDGRAGLLHRVFSAAYIYSTAGQAGHRRNVGRGTRRDARNRPAAGSIAAAAASAPGIAASTGGCWAGGRAASAPAAGLPFRSGRRRSAWSRSCRFAARWSATRCRRSARSLNCSAKMCPAPNRASAPEGTWRSGLTKSRARASRSVHVGAAARISWARSSKPRDAGQRRQRLFLRLVRQIEVFQPLGGRGRLDLLGQLLGQLALALDGTQDRLLAIRQQTHLRQPGKDLADLFFIHPPRLVLAIAGDEGNRIAFIQEFDHGLNLAEVER